MSEIPRSHLASRRPVQSATPDFHIFDIHTGTLDEPSSSGSSSDFEEWAEDTYELPDGVHWNDGNRMELVEWAGRHPSVDIGLFDSSDSDTSDTDEEIQQGTHIELDHFGESHGIFHPPILHPMVSRDGRLLSPHEFFINDYRL